MRMSIAASVQEELLYIGMTQKLQERIGSKVPHVLAKCPPYARCLVDPNADCQLNNAEKEALAQGKQLMVWWAEAGSSQLSLYKAELLHAYMDAHHGKLPGIMSRDGKWVPGARLIPKKRGRSAIWTGKG